MVRVTDKQYYMEDALKKKLDLMIDRTTGNNKFDNVLLVDGDEGYGKSNIASGIAYYVAHETGRPFDVDWCFFDLEMLSKVAKETEEKILVWDEGALGGLATEWWSKNQRDFIKLLMTCRKKRHFFIICIPKFFKLNEYLVVDRSIGLVHVYARKEYQLGRFVYFSKKAKERLYEKWKRNRKREYKKFSTLRGTFPETLGLIYDEKLYDKKKEEGIQSIGKTDVVSSKDKRIYQIRYYLYDYLKNKGELSKFSKIYNIPPNTLSRWGEFPNKYPQFFDDTPKNAVNFRFSHSDTVTNGVVTTNTIK